ncbi:MAG: hypothetical protein DHS20C09_17210 [marine bacterium B5-7]|nr:MAG: hypothetical protein DHS20C09_17210 [marine bacterium B5-7]
MCLHSFNKLGGAMSEENDVSSNSDTEAERIPVMQQIIDNPFLLLFLGVTIPTVFYVIWGIMEIITIPVAK